MATRRQARVPKEADRFLASLGKSDLVEMVWSLASLANEAGSCDDDDSTFQRCVEEASALKVCSRKAVERALRDGLRPAHPSTEKP